MVDGLNQRKPSGSARGFYLDEVEYEGRRGKKVSAAASSHIYLARSRKRIKGYGYGLWGSMGWYGMYKWVWGTIRVGRTNGTNVILPWDPVARVDCDLWTVDCGQSGGWWVAGKR